MGASQALPVFESYARASVVRAPLRIAVFWDQDFPAVDVEVPSRDTILDALRGHDVRVLDAHALAQSLEGYDVLVHPYGSAFPKHAAQSVLDFLRRGGHWVNLGGVPLAVPVRREGEAWTREQRTTAYHKGIGITQAFPVAASRIDRMRPVTAAGAALADHIHPETVYEFTARFTDRKDFADEDGSAGPRDAVLTPLVHGLDADGIPIAAPVVSIDRLLGDFAGGRWVFAAFDGRMDREAIRALVEYAGEGTARLSVRTAFACYTDGERPTITVELRQGRERSWDATACRIAVWRDEAQDAPLFERDVDFTRGDGFSLARVTLPSSVSLPPGLYRVRCTAPAVPETAKSSAALEAGTGFWIHDAALLARGDAFSNDGTFFRRGGKPYPVTGTTYMGSDVHRKFLFEPNPARWDDDFRAMKASGITMVRTGIWTGWKRAMLDAGAPDEGVLRAFDALLLTAKRHDIPLIFTFFAFLPESWGGENPFLDPRSIAAQKEFILAFVQRARTVPDMTWDLINEPSFSSARALWQCRPNGDRFETAAWSAWLTERYPAADDATRRDLLQERYRATAFEDPALPGPQDFDDRNIFEATRPVKAIDYRLFAQEMFTRWAKHLADAIRATGHPKQMVTVGQDEGGTVDRPSPQFHAEAVDFTCIHNWWANDDLLWDAVVTKTPGRPNLAEEAGVMFYEKMDGSPWRTERQAADLLERKLAISVAAGSAGFIEWIWNTNPYMNLDNEAAIGLFRAAGTAKPEFERLRSIARFMREHAAAMTGAGDPDVLMVIPHARMFSVRNAAVEATQHAVRAMWYRCRTRMSAVSEYRLSAVTHPPALVLLPSPRILSGAAWKTLTGWMQDGVTLLATGYFEADDGWMPADRINGFGISCADQPVASEEILRVGSDVLRLPYRGNKLQRIEKAVVEGDDGMPAVRVKRIGNGRLVWSPLPVENCDAIEPAVALYRFALREASVKPVFALDPDDPAILVIPLPLAEATMYAVISDSGVDTDYRLTDRRSGASVRGSIRGGRAQLHIVNRNGTVSSSE